MRSSQWVTWTAIAALAAVLAGCATGMGDLLGPSKSEKTLATGVTQYEDGNYADAAKNLQGALDAGLTQKSDQVRAHKYLAFIACVSDREKECRKEFLIALQIDPGFELKASEAGHPIWGPVFRSIKSGK